MSTETTAIDARVSPARSTDPATAHEAAEANPDARGVQRAAVYRYLKACAERGATDYETGAALGILRTSAGKRRKELCECGLIGNSGIRRETDTGSSAIVWVLAEYVRKDALREQPHQL